MTKQNSNGSRASSFQDNQTNAVYWLNVNTNTNWTVYVQVGVGEVDYANPITKLSSLPKRVRDWVSLEIGQHSEDHEQKSAGS